MYAKISCTWLMLVLCSCYPDSSRSNKSPESNNQTKQELTAEFLHTYANIVSSNYQNSLKLAEELQTAIANLTGSPSLASLNEAKKSWILARQSYSQTEAFRFYHGPIDNEQGPEPRINGWPLDEAVIDYTQTTNSGLINEMSQDITKQTIINSSNDDTPTLGYHSIEFLLWGQDFSLDGPGERSFQDYLEGPEATQENGKRRGQFINLVAEVLHEDLAIVTSQWNAADQDNFRSKFIASPETSMEAIFSGLGKFIQGEIVGERLDPALDSLDQEDEQSCFSDNTKNDLIYNFQGITNILLGTYNGINGVGLLEVIREKDAELASDLLSDHEAAKQAIADIPHPFDKAVAKINSDSWMNVKKAADSLTTFAFSLEKVAKSFGYDISLELDSSEEP